ncbi:MAG: radical SAM protein, partial [Acidobacteriota bacterium]
LQAVVQAGPDIINHNLEVPESFYSKINRPRGNYKRSLQVLALVKERGIPAKSGLMLGLGETEKDIEQTLIDLRLVSCDLLTLGQYLQPSKAHVPVRKYYSPSEFNLLKKKALSLGFKGVEAGPLVRSSYRAHRLYQITCEAAG